MGLKATNSGADFELCPGGTYIARCYRVIDKGTTENSFGKMAHKVLISWELPTTLMHDGKPFSVHSTYTASTHEKSNLRRDLTQWRGAEFTQAEIDEFDLKRVLGVPGYLTVIHNEKGDRTYANVAGIISLPQGIQCPPAFNPPVVFDMDAPSKVVFDAFSDGMKDMVRKAQEWPVVERMMQGVPPEIGGDGFAKPQGAGQPADIAPPPQPVVSGADPIEDAPKPPTDADQYHGNMPGDETTVF
jgi:hypothetical protein